MVDILFVIDSYNREYFGIKLLYNKLKDKGFKVQLCGKYSVVEAVNFYKPKAITVSAIDFSYIPQVSENVYIIYIPAEGVNGNIDYIKLYHSGLYPGCSVYAEYIDLVFCWSKNYEKGIEEFFDHNILQVTGSPFTDYYYLPSQKKTVKKSIGIGTSFRNLNPVSPVNQIENIDIVSRLNGEDIFFEKPYNVEDWYAIEISAIRNFILVSIRLSQEFNIDFRPHPLENEKNYQYIESLSDNIKVHNKESINQWLNNNEVIIGLFSSIFTDAYALGKKVFSIKNILPEHVYDAVPKPLKRLDDFIPAPKSIDELIQIIKSDEEQVLPEMDKLLYESSNYTKDGIPAYIQIADSIEGFLVKNERKEYKKLKSNAKIRQYFFKEIYSFFNAKILKSTNPGLSYTFYNYFRNRKNNRYINDIYNQLESIYSKNETKGN